jgi:hypothetical protein
MPLFNLYTVRPLPFSSLLILHYKFPNWFPSVFEGYRPLQEILTWDWLLLISSHKLQGALPDCLPLKLDSLLMLIAHNFIHVILSLEVLLLSFLSLESIAHPGLYWLLDRLPWIEPLTLMLEGYRLRIRHSHNLSPFLLLLTYKSFLDICALNKVEIPYHDNDLILTLIISPQSGWQWTWSCPKLHMGGFRDGGWQIFDIWEVSLDGTPNFFIHTWTFLAINFVASQLFLCLFWISLWLKNRCLQHPCFKNLCKIAQASKNSDSNAQHFISDLLTHSWFHSMLFAVPSYQSTYIVMNRCLYLSTLTHNINWYHVSSYLIYSANLSLVLRLPSREVSAERKISI